MPRRGVDLGLGKMPRAVQAEHGESGVGGKRLDAATILDLKDLPQVLEQCLNIWAMLRGRQSMGQ